MTAPDLLPCPFCGGEAVYDFHAKGQPGAWENDCDHWVYCRADDCFANVGLCESKAEAIAAWNTRATPAAIREAELEDAPIYYDNDAAHAWVSGYNSAIFALIKKRADHE